MYSTEYLSCEFGGAGHQPTPHRSERHTFEIDFHQVHRVLLGCISSACCCLGGEVFVQITGSPSMGELYKVDSNLTLYILFIIVIYVTSTVTPFAQFRTRHVFNLFMHLQH